MGAMIPLLHRDGMSGPDVDRVLGTFNVIAFDTARYGAREADTARHGARESDTARHGAPEAE
jgi:hypothetical protein